MCPRLRALALLLGALTVAACSQPRPSVPPSLVPSAQPQPGLRVHLAWDAPADLDLYVTDPAAETVYFGNTPARSGGRLAMDARCSQVRGGEAARELIVWDAPPVGAYRLGVDYLEACTATAEPVAFRVLVEVAGQHLEGSGHIALERFQPIVMEFVVRADADGSPVLAPLEGSP